MKAIYVKHESSITYHSEAMNNVKVFVDKNDDRLFPTERSSHKAFTCKIWGPYVTPCKSDFQC